MFKKRVLVTILSCLLIFLIALFFEVDNVKTNMFTRIIAISSDRTSNYVDNDMNVEEVNTNKETTKVEEGENVSTQTDTNTIINISDNNSVEFEIAIAQPAVVYDGMTMNELASKLERSLKNELSGKGYLYASYSLEKGVDPYLAVAISLEETGCNWNCSRLVKTCNNVGGMKGSGCGSYGHFPTLDDGIKAFIDNIYRNYVAYGLTTADTMNPKYAENPKWSTNVNNYIARIKNS